MAGIQYHHLFMSLLLCVFLSMVKPKDIPHISSKGLKYNGVVHIKSTEILKSHYNFFKKNDCVYSLSKCNIHYAWASRSTLPTSKSQEVLDQKRPYIRTENEDVKKCKCRQRRGNFPDRKDCTKYYICLIGKPSSHQPCKDPELYDVKEKECRHKENVDCRPRFNPRENEYVKKCKCRQRRGNFPDSKNCTKYHFCCIGKAAHETCKDPELYDVKEKKCKPKDQVDCGSRFNPRELETKAPETTNVPTTGPTTEPTRQEQSTPEEPITVTDSEGTSKDSDDITSSVTNNEGTSKDPDDITSSVTDNEGTAKDTGETNTDDEITQEITDNPVTDESPPSVTSNIVTNEILSTAETTEGGLSSEMPTTQSSSTEFTRAVSSIIEPKDLCVPEDSTCIVGDDGSVFRCPKSEGHHPHPSDLTKFIHCDNFRIHVVDCPSELHFDPEYDVCTYPPKESSSGELIGKTQNQIDY